MSIQNEAFYFAQIRGTLRCYGKQCMSELKLEIKVAFIPGLREIVLKEISQYPNLRVIKEEGGLIYLAFVHDFAQLLQLRSVLKMHVIEQSSKYNPFYISNHKSIIGNLVSLVIENRKDEFQSFKIICAGAGSSEVRSIVEYIKETYGLIEDEDADLKIHIINTGNTWEVGAQVTARPLSLRGYRVGHMSGALNPTIAYAMNSLCNLGSASSYLNVFSGSATLLIEAGQCYPNLKKPVGLDNNKRHLSLAIQNIKKAGLIRRIQLKERDIFDKPDLGKFDVITSDLPFGMSIAKGEDLGSLYQRFIKYCQETLNSGGRLAIYTSEYEMLERVILESEFEVIKTLELKLVTAVGSYLRPKIFICRHEPTSL